MDAFREKNHILIDIFTQTLIRQKIVKKKFGDGFREPGGT
jgi:hypothetical protein